MRLPFPNLLATRNGRLLAFFLLYVTEGIPLGFTATAIATQMRRQGLGTEAIGVFIASLYLPWGFKWVVGPFVDTISSDRFGRRKTWIVLAQMGLVATLLIAIPINFTAEIKLFTALMFLANSFGATQDVAIDALAVNVLPEHERGTANGFMFGGAYVGQAIGGSAVLFLSQVIPFRTTYFFVAGMIFLVTLFVALPLQEPASPPRPSVIGSKLRAVGNEIGTFVKDAWSAFTGTRAAFLGLIFAILPAGAYALSLGLQSNLAVELGLTDGQIATLNLWSTILSALACIAGGWFSDRIGRRLSLALFFAATILPTIALGLAMQSAGWIHAVSPTMPNRPVPPPGLVSMFWAMSLAYAVIQGLGYGVRTAMFMDVTTPRVAATQFTAYMALLNLVTTYTSVWQGSAIARFGYPVTLFIDSSVGLVSLFLLPFMAPHKDRTAVVLPGTTVPEGVTP
jgi:PAT family beta-lactamase induction signal transducer AmpG